MAYLYLSEVTSVDEIWNMATVFGGDAPLRPSNLFAATEDAQQLDREIRGWLRLHGWEPSTEYRTGLIPFGMTVDLRRTATRVRITPAASGE